MKKLLSGLALAAFSMWASATTFTPIQLLNPTGSVAGQVIVSSGPTTVAAWGGIGLSGITAIAANTVLANATGSSASPTAFAMPSCTGTSNALGYTAGTGIICNGSINAVTLGGVAAASYLTSATAASTYATIAQATTALAATGGSINGVTSGLTTPAASKVTTLVATSTITPSTTAGIVGTTLGDNANAGSVGEAQPTTTSGTSLSTGVPANCASETLTAGDWDVSGTVQFIPAGTTIITAETAAISAVSATIGAVSQSQVIFITHAAGQGDILNTGYLRVDSSSSTTVFAVGSLNFNTSTATCTGFIHARRIR